MDHVPKHGPLQIGLMAAVHLTGAVVDVVPRVQHFPVTMNLTRVEDVIERDGTSQSCMLDGTREDEELTAEFCGVDISDDIVLIVEERLHQPALDSVEGTEATVVRQRERVDTLGGQLLVLRIHESVLMV